MNTKRNNPETHSDLTQRVQDDIKEYQTNKRMKHSKTLSQARLKGHKFKKLSEFS